MFQNYLNVILMNPILASSLPVRKFLDPDNYATPFQGLCIHAVTVGKREGRDYMVVS
jgi:PX domain-containing protein kinase-like protein